MFLTSRTELSSVDSHSDVFNDVKVTISSIKEKRYTPLRTVFGPSRTRFRTYVVSIEYLLYLYRSRGPLQSEC